MMNLNKRRLLLTTAVCLLPIVAGLALYSRLPEQIATHFDFNGTPNGYSSRAFAVLGLPGIMAGLNVLVQVLLCTDPKRRNIGGAMMGISAWIVPVTTLITSAVILGGALGADMQAERIIPAAVGVLFILIGNYLPKTKQNYSAGIKLPWTLNSEENWNRTHRLAGFLWVLGGVIFALASLLGIGGAWLLGAMILAMVLVPGVYSYILYTKGI